MKITTQDVAAPPPSFLPFDVVIRVEAGSEYEDLLNLAGYNQSIPGLVRGDSATSYDNTKAFVRGLGIALRARS